MSYFNDDNDAVYCEVGYVNDPDNEVVAIFYRKETNGKSKGIVLVIRLFRVNVFSDLS